jgi:hypothetical protein
MTGLTRAGSPKRWLAFLALVAVVAAACASSGAALSAVGGAVTAAPMPAAGTDSEQNAGSPGGAPVPAASAGPTGQVAQSDLLVIKTGSLALQVGSIDDSLAAAGTKIAALGGYVSGSQRQGDGKAAVASVTYRIPAARWDDAVIALRGLAQKVLSEQTQTDEVTGQVLDLGARIVNLQATERALQSIMDKAIKISDVLDVQAQLTDVRGQIEQLETEQKHLEEQAAYGTLDVTYGIETVAVVEAQKGFDPAAEADRATASLVEVGQALAGAGIWFGIFWLPILLVIGVLALIAFVVIRRFRRDHIGPTGPGTGAPDPIVPTAGA